VYEDNPDQSSLRQGDVLADVIMCGRLNLGNVLVPGWLYTKGEEQGTPQWWMVNAKCRHEFTMVLSHDCEIARENNAKLASIILAPIVDVSHQAGIGRVPDLIASNKVNPNEPERSFLKYFYIEPHPAMQFNEGGAVDFSCCFSVHPKSYDFLLSRKKCQLLKSAAEDMAYKLGLYFYRHGLKKQEDGTAK